MLIHGVIPEFFMTNLNNGSLCEGGIQWESGTVFCSKRLTAVDVKYLTLKY